MLDCCCWITKIHLIDGDLDSCMVRPVPVNIFSREFVRSFLVVYIIKPIFRAHVRFWKDIVTIDSLDLQLSGENVLDEFRAVDINNPNPENRSREFFVFVKLEVPILGKIP